MVRPTTPTEQRDADGPSVVVCDDLTGACEIAGLLQLNGHRSVIPLAPVPHRGDVVNVIDLGLRDLAPDDARRSMAAAIAEWPVTYVKIDSLVRGPIAAIVQGARADHRQLLLCPALPSAGRTVENGVVLLHGIPLSATDAWRLEPGDPPTRLTDVVAPVPTATFQRPGQACSPATSCADDVVLCADAVSDDDLDQLADVVRSLHLLPIGAAGLFAALLRRGILRPPAGEPDELAGVEPPERPAVTGVLVVVGTGHPKTVSQIDQLRTAGATVVTLDTDRSGIDMPAAAHRALGRGGTLVVHWPATDAPDPRRSAALSARLADTVEQLVATDPTISLVLTGGHTARSTLERLGVTTLRPRTVVHHGAVVVVTDDGRRVAIRPGSFGTDRSLVDMRNAVA